MHPIPAAPTVADTRRLGVHRVEDISQARVSVGDGAGSDLKPKSCRTMRKDDL